MTTSASSACQALISRYVSREGHLWKSSRSCLQKGQQPRGTHIDARGHRQKSILALLDNGDVSCFSPIYLHSIGSHVIAASIWSWECH